MTDYSLLSPESVAEIGRRAKRLRDLLGLTVEQVAAEAAIEAREVASLEAGEAVSLAAALAVHRVLSRDAVGADLFTHPRFRSIDEVVAYERRRLAGR